MTRIDIVTAYFHLDLHTTPTIGAQNQNRTGAQHIALHKNSNRPDLHALNEKRAAILSAVALHFTPKAAAYKCAHRKRAARCIIKSGSPVHILKWLIKMPPWPAPASACMHLILHSSSSTDPHSRASCEKFSCECVRKRKNLKGRAQDGNKNKQNAQQMLLFSKRAGNLETKVLRRPRSKTPERC
jgi:hypothetical protein